MKKALHFINKQALLWCLFLISGVMWGQVVISRQDFESTPATPTLNFTTTNIATPSTANFSSGTSGGSASPNANMFSEGARGYRVAGDAGTAGRILTFSNVNTTGYTGISVVFRVAGMSIGTTGNGMDNTGTPNENDKVLVEISPDGGTTWYQQAKVVSSGSNFRWYFGATGSGTRAYAANNSLSSFNTTANVLSGSGNTAISTVTITGLPSINNLRVRITCTSDNANESWLIDDVRITGTVAVVNPTVTTVIANSITATDAIISGTINANGLTVNSSFQYGTTAAYGSAITGDPTPVTGTTSTTVEAIIESLSPNTQYFYRAVGTVGATITNGSNLTFYTLANIPGVLIVNNPLQTTIDVTVNATTQNSNPASTQFAIKEAGGQYIQANGTLGATAVWQTASTWGTKTVTGLTPATLYTFSAKAKNGADVETAFGGTASGTTAVAQTVDFAKIQFPNTTQNIDEGGSLDVFARVYEAGLTDSAGEKANLKGWIGYSSTNDNPANAGWTWVPATFFAEYGNDDEYKASLNGLAIGTYYYASRFQIGTGAFVYGGTNGIWNSDSVTLNINPIVVDFANIQFPTTAQSITEGGTLDVFARTFEQDLTTNTGSQSNLFGWIGYSSTNDNPANAGWTWVAAAFNADFGNNDEYKATLSGLPIGTYYYASRFQIGTGQFVYGGTNGNWDNDSVQLIVNADMVDFANIQSPATATITEGATVAIYAQVYELGVTEVAGQGAGITGQIGYSTTDSTPDNSWTWIDATFNVQDGNNDEYQINLGTGLAPGTYYYASRFKKDSSISETYAYGGTSGIWTAGNNGVLTVNGLGAPLATAGTNVGATSFTANWDSVTDATSYRLDVSTSPTFTGGSISLAEWTFPTDGAVVTPAVSSSNNTGKTLTTNGGAITDSSADNTRSASANAWLSGGGSKYWQVDFDATGFYSISLSSAQRSSNTGPKNFKVQYKVGAGSWTDTGSVVTVANDFTTGVANLTLPASCDNQPSVSVRWIMTDNTSVNNGTVASGGTSRIDDIILSTTGVAFVPGYENLNVGNVTLYEVTGLDPETTYYYRVRAVLGTNISTNSNVVEVITTSQSTLTTWTIVTPPTTTGWTNGAPTASIDAIIDADYNETDPITAKNLTINTGKVLTVKPTSTLKVAGNLTNDGSIVFESTAAGTGRFDAYTGTAIAGSGSATVQRYIDGKRAFRFLAPGVNTTGSILTNWQAQTHITGSTTGANGFDATISGNPSMFTFGTDSWTPIANTNVLTLDARTGYRLLIRGNRSINLAVVSQPNMNAPITLSATGSLVTGEVQYNSLTSTASEGFTLVANPYASPINWETITKTGIKSAYQVWDPKLGTGTQRGRYVACEVGATSIIDGVGSTASGLNQYIQTGQSFFIENTVLNTSGTVLIKESDKVDNYVYAFKTPTSNTEVTSVGKLGVTLYEATAFSLGEYAIDGAVAVSNASFSTALDESDVTKLLSSGEQVAFTRSGKVLGIEKVSTVLPTDELAIKSINLIANKPYVWSVTLQNDFTQEQVYLYDAFTQAYHSVSGNGTTTVNFDTNGGGNALALDRFKIVFQNTTLGNQTFNKMISLYPNPGSANTNSFYIQGISSEAKVFLYNVLGQVVPVKTTTEQDGLKVEITSPLTSGVYLVNIETDGKTAQKKWIVQ